MANCWANRYTAQTILFLEFMFRRDTVTNITLRQKPDNHCRLMQMNVFILWLLINIFAPSNKRYTTVNTHGYDGIKILSDEENYPFILCCCTRSAHGNHFKWPKNYVKVARSSKNTHIFSRDDLIASAAQYDILWFAIHATINSIHLRLGSH